MNRGESMQSEKYSIERIARDRDKAKRKLQKVRELYTKSVDFVKSNKSGIDMSSVNGVDEEIIKMSIAAHRLDAYREQENVLVDYVNLCSHLIELKQNVEVSKVRNSRKISDEDVKRIKYLKKCGYSYSKISCDTGWSKGTISNVLNGKYDD